MSLIEEIERDLLKLAKEEQMKRTHVYTGFDAEIIPGKNEKENEEMKNSEKYYHAMLCVLQSGISSDRKLEILELLMDDRKTALFVEKREEEKKENEE